MQLAHHQPAQVVALRSMLAFERNALVEKFARGQGAIRYQAHGQPPSRRATGGFYLSASLLRSRREVNVDLPSIHSAGCACWRMSSFVFSRTLTKGSGVTVAPPRNG